MNVIIALLSDNLLIAIVSGIGGVLIALASPLLVYRGFNSIERRLEVMEGDIKQFFKDTARYEADINMLKERMKELPQNGDRRHLLSNAADCKAWTVMAWETLALVLSSIAIWAVLRSKSKRSNQRSKDYVYRNADGSAREIHASEHQYLDCAHSGSDGNRQYLLRSRGQSKV